MKQTVSDFRGLLPIRGRTKLPPGFASTALNTKLVSGDIEGYLDIGNPFQLSKPAPIIALGRIPDYAMPNQLDWLQFSASELASFAFDIKAIAGTSLLDTTNRRYITGYAAYNGVPQFTNSFYATGEENRGSHLFGAYPYETFPLGVADPANAPTVSAPTASGTTTNFEYAQEESVNSALVHTGGTGYTIADSLSGTGGTLAPGLSAYPWMALVSSVDPTTGAVTGISLEAPGFYTAGNAPASPDAVTGGTGIGATFDLSTVGQNTTGWDYVRFVGGGSLFNFVVSGNRWLMTMQQGAAGNGWSTNYSSQSFGLKSASTINFQIDAAGQDNGAGQYPDITLTFAGTFNGTFAVQGPGIQLSFVDGDLKLYSNMNVGTSGGSVSPGTGGAVVSTATYAFVGGTQYRIFVEMTANTAGTTAGYTVVCNVATPASPGTILASVTGFVPYAGEAFGVGINNRVLPSSNAQDANFENILITVVQPASDVTVESTNYVYTYVQELPGDPLTQESGPSDPSSTLDVFIDGTTNPPTRTSVTVVIPPAPSGEFIEFYNIYRLVLGSDGSETYTFVAQVAASTSASVTYVDSAQDTAIGPDVLISQNWSPPPANMQGIIALPNGIMAGFFDNVLCLSAQNYPHAWPVDNQYAVDSLIQGLGVADQTVLILPQSHPYTAWGSDPSAFSMSKETAVQGCTSGRGIVSHKVLGVIFPSGNGIAYYRGQGQLDLVRTGPFGQPPFSIEQWKALAPPTIHAIMHDDNYWFWYGDQGCFVLDLDATGFGMIAVDVHTTVAFVDDQSDTLYLVPDFSIYPVNGAVVTQPLNIISQWEYADAFRERVWERDEILLSRPAAFSRARVRTAGSGSVTLLAESEVGTAYNAAVPSENMFVIGNQPGSRWNVGCTITGDSVVNTIELGETPADILGAE